MQFNAIPNFVPLPPSPIKTPPPVQDYSNKSMHDPRVLEMRKKKAVSQVDSAQSTEQCDPPSDPLETRKTV